MASHTHTHTGLQSKRRDKVSVWSLTLAGIGANINGKWKWNIILYRKNRIKISFVQRPTLKTWAQQNQRVGSIVNQLSVIISTRWREKHTHTQRSGRHCTIALAGNQRSIYTVQCTSMCWWLQAGFDKWIALCEKLKLTKRTISEWVEEKCTPW